MLKNNSGIFLMEAMYALLITVTAVLALFPIACRVYTEKMTISETHWAISILNEQLIEWQQDKADPPKQIEDHGQLFHLSSSLIEKNHIKLCVQWKGSNGRELKQCAEAKR
ncbi:hypothetical protein [Scopulibacillus cellulosilyticus]|uniref:Competence protein ComGE n=1 Tax=Scopulibacillus cellulosilyticus TaxID=2665665 RepID=A0ABW2PY26_9BACL